MAPTDFCPYCKSSQSEQAEVNGPPDGYCRVCGYPLQAEPTPATAFRPATILWIDDDRLLLSFCCDALNQRGYRTLVAADGTSGIETAKTERPDLIILDVVMPGMDGIEVCRRLRAEPATRDTPIILLTAFHSPKVSLKGREAGATSTIRKPFGPEHIIDAIGKILGPKAPPRTL
ncbi:MAG: response regulator [Zetaproteobacteria bacterium]|nr:MAG: response regulator [Zetaproteobacteria bacterium]